MNPKTMNENKLFLFSAKTKKHLMKYIDRLIDYLSANQVDGDQLSYTLIFGRDEMDERLAVIASNQAQLLEKLRIFADGRVEDFYCANKNDAAGLYSEIMKQQLLQSFLQGDLDNVARNWVNGAKIDWSSLYDENRKMLRLPAHPFVRESYWYSGLEKQSMLFLREKWEPVSYSRDKAVYENCMIVGTSRQLILKDRLEAIMGTAFSAVVEITDSGEMSVPEDAAPDMIFFLGGMYEDSAGHLSVEEYERVHRFGALAFLELIKKFSKHVTFKVLLNCSACVNDAESRASIYTSDLYGLCKTTMEEYRSVQVICMDFTAGRIEDTDEQELIQAVRNAVGKENLFLALRGEKCYRRILGKQELQAAGEEFFRMRGVYVILGGLGGIGFHTAKYLVRRYQADLLLVGRRELNPQMESQIEELRSYGSKVIYVRGDLTDAEKMIKAFRQYRDEFFQIDGVIHSVAVTENSLLRDMTTVQYDKVVMLQMEIFVFLEYLCKTFAIKKYLIFSSAAGYFGNQGGANYSASNSMKDAFAQWLGEKYAVCVKNIDWGLWADVGMGKEYADVLGKKFSGVIPISRQEGLDAIDRIVHSDCRQIIALTASKEYLEKETDLFRTEQRNRTTAIAGKEEHPAAGSDMIKKIAARNLKMKPEDIHDNVPLGDYGMDSVMGIHIKNDLEEIFGELPATFMYENYTVQAIKNYFAQNQPDMTIISEEKNDRQTVDVREEDIAIIGAAGIYPDADNLDEFWENLSMNRFCVREMPEDRYDWRKYEESGRIYTHKGAFIRNYDKFDSLFFQISPKEAKGMDPQERLFLQVAYHTLNDAGYPRNRLKHAGVFVGVTNNTYQMQGVENFVRDMDEPIPFAQWYSIANRVSYVFDFDGPSMAVDTACSSSLAAIHLACESLLNGECEVALAGGVNLYLHPYKYASLCQMNMLSQNGRCAAFQETADGFIPGEGIGAILLKSLKKAMEDGDNIQAVIKATAMNHGGHTNGYTVPNPGAQAELIRQAVEKAGMDPASIDYIEAHGTGTMLGDPIEVAGLQMAYGKHFPAGSTCALGSVKANIGHLEAASGVASLTKVLLQMKYKMKAGSYIVDAPNRNIDFAALPFTLQDKTEEWQRKYDAEGRGIPHRAGISSFGAGGANIHIIMEEFPLEAEGELKNSSENVAVLSAKTREQLIAMSRSLCMHIRKNAENALYNHHNICFTLQTGRDEFEQRVAFVIDSKQSLLSELEKYVEGIESGRRFESGCRIGEDSLQNGIADKEILEIVKQWIDGDPCDWKKLYGDFRPKRISLPGYAFQEKHFLMETVRYTGERQTEQMSGNSSFEKKLSRDDQILKDHCVQGKSVYPGAGYITLLLECLRKNDSQGIILRNIKFESMLVVDEDDTFLRTEISGDSGKRLCRIFSGKQQNFVKKHFECVAVEEVPENRKDLKAPDQVRKIELSHTCFGSQEIYDKYNELGMQYGSGFRKIVRLYRNEFGVLGELEKSYVSEQEVLEPGFLDGALQTVLGYHMQRNAAAMMPCYIQSIEIRKYTDWRYIFTQKDSAINSQYDLVIYDSDWQECCWITGFFVKEAVEHPAEKKEQEDPGLVRKMIKEIVSELLEIPVRDLNDGIEFGEYGFDSLSFSGFADRINEKFDAQVSPALFYEYPTIEALTNYLSPKCRIAPAKQEENAEDVISSGRTGKDIAIIGIAGRLPMSDSLDDFWEGLTEGKDFIREIPPERWDWKEFYGNPVAQKNKTTANRGGFIEHADYFDASFFHISKFEAELMDPQQRIMLELTWNAVEDAGYSMSELSGRRIGIVLGVPANSEYNTLLNEYCDTTEVYQSTGVAASVLVNRISYQFNWHGISEPVDTACSSSLVAIHRACLALMNNECDMAVAGGTNIILTPKGAISFEKAGLLSKDGKCKTFSEQADGYVRSEGMGVVLLKPYDKAVKDGDAIYALIKGSSVNHGGKGNSLTAPNPKAQADVIVDAMKKAEIDFSDVDFIETHGTGTKVGDVIELNGLKLAYSRLRGENTAHKVALTAVKANVGHLETAAGMAGIFKTVYAIRKRELPPQIYADRLNPDLDFENSPFYVCRKGERLNGKTITAGISSFGFGGVNAHLVLQSCPEVPQSGYVKKKKYLILLSAQKKANVLRRAEQLLAYIDSMRGGVKCESNDTVADELCEIFSRHLKMSRSDVAKDLLLSDMGLDVLGMEQILSEINQRYSKQLTIKLLLSLETIQNISDYLGRRMKTEVHNEVGDAWEKEVLSELEYTFCTRRDQMDVRMALVAESLEDLCDQLWTIVRDHSFDEDAGALYPARLTEEQLVSLFRREQYDEIIRHWMQKENLHFEACFPNGYQRKLHLPGYPFSTDSFWYRPLSPAQEKCTFELLESDLKEYEYLIDLNFMYDLLKDHRVGDRVILPGAFSLTVLNAVNGKINKIGTPFTVKNLFWLSPCELFEGGENKLYVSIRKNSDLEIRLISVRAEKTVHVMAQILQEKAEEEAEFMTDLRGEEGMNIPVGELYGMYDTVGLHYGKSFRTLENVSVSGDEAYGTVGKTDSDPYTCGFHPALIDGVFQIAAALNAGSESDKMSIPFSVRKISVLKEVNDRCFAVLKKYIKNGEQVSYDICVSDENGSPAVIFRDFTCKEYTVGSNSGEICFVRSMVEAKRKDSFGDRNAELYPEPVFGDIVSFDWEQISKKKEQLNLVVQLGEYQENEEFIRLFAFLKKLLSKCYGEKVTCIFLDSGQPLKNRKALTGLLRTATLENPSVRIKLLEGEVTEEQLREEMTNFDYLYENIRYLDGKRYLGSLKKIDIGASASGPAFLRNGVYLLVGGQGGIGYCLTEYLVRKYQATVLVISRKAQLSQKMTELMKNQGADIRLYCADVTDYDSLEFSMREILKDYPVINGIFHLAGALNDGLIFSKKEDAMKNVLAPKVTGIQNLDKVTRDMEIDFMCLFSSTAAVNGNAGQADYAYANGYMDDFADRRNTMEKRGERKGICYSVNWPFWEEGGMNLSRKILDRQWKDYGIQSLPTSDGMEILEKILHSGYTNVACFYGDREKIEKSLSLMNLIEPGRQDAAQQEMMPRDSGHRETVRIAEPESKEGLRKTVRDEVTSIFAGLLRLKPEEIDTGEDIESYGFNSLMMVEALERLEALAGEGADFSPGIINDCKTIDRIADYLTEHSVEDIRIKEKNPVAGKNDAGICEDMEDNDRIAVIGMACRFPKADDPEEYFRNLYEGRDLIEEVPEERWNIEDHYSEDSNQVNTTVSRYGSFLENIDKFDASYFGITETDAEVMDPQQRIMLELAEELRCSSGYERNELSGKKVGVFIGASESSYVKSHLNDISREGMKHLVVGTIQNMIAARISDYYNLVGSAMVIDTACSSSLVAIDEACRQIRTGECDMAVAGGIQLLIDPVTHVGLSQAGVLTRERTAYVFDERSQGIMIGEGAGLVMLKRWKDAVRDGDMIQAVILASAVNNDGHTMGLTTPNMERQKEVIVKAVEASGISPETISYYEAHGTGTLLGDPIEIKAASEVYGRYSKKKGYCSVGSVKSNMGHLLRAAGIAGFIKVVLEMKHRMIVKTLHCERPHPRFHFQDSPFCIAADNKPWVQEEWGMRAAISSFGFGGTNCHMILESAKEVWLPKRKQLKKPEFHRKTYWLGKKEKAEEQKSDLEQILIRLKNNEITPDEAILLEKVQGGNGSACKQKKNI